jgi:serine phosphatase RsbU (regulator of sigma subunit)
VASPPLQRPGRTPGSPPPDRGEALGSSRYPRPAAPAGRGLHIPIALKFAVLITVLVLIFMVWLTATAMRVAEESQDAAVNEDGTTKVIALAALIDPNWIKSTQERSRLQTFLAAYCLATRDWGVLNAMVYGRFGGEALVTGKPGETSFRLDFGQGRDVPFPAAAQHGVSIHELAYNGEPTRLFSKEVVDSPGGGQPIGRMEVLLSAARITRSRDAIRDRMTMVSLASSLVAAVVSFLLARYLTSPIRTLAKDLRQVSMGNLDHQSKVRSADEIGDLARTFNGMTANLRQAQDAVVARKALEHELNLATRIQTKLLPSTIPEVPGFDVAAYYQAAREVGGDYYDFIRIDEEHLGIVVADVSGKGVPGSLIMTMTRSLLRMAAAGQPSPYETICQVNRVLAPDVNPGMFVTLLYLVLHIPTGKIRMVRSGHNSPLLHVARVGKLIQLQPRGIALGLDRGKLFDAELEVQQFSLKAGDVLVAYTDGIVEGKDPQGADYSDERFARVIQREAAGDARSIIDAVLGDLERHRRGADQSDDITLLVMKSRLKDAGSGA